MCANPHTRKLDWDDLRAFLAVARSGRLTVAARRLGLDHSTLSRRVSGLEAALRVALFERSPAGYKITEAGQKLAAEVQAMESAVIRIQTHVADDLQRLTGPTRLTMPEGFSTSFFVHRLPELRAIHPEISIELIADPSIVSLTKREADIAIMMERPAQGPLVSRKLCEYEYGLYCSREYKASHPEIRAVTDIARHFVIGYIPDLLPTPAHDYLRDFMSDRDADLQISNILTQVEVTRGGLGIALLPCFMTSRHEDLVRLLPRDIVFNRSYWIVTHEESRYPVRTGRVKDFIIEQVRHHRAHFEPSRRGP